MDSVSAPRPRVLIADDERAIADALRAIFQQNGFDADAAYDGQTAFELACACPPNVFVSDVCMPGISGVEAAIMISERMPWCRVLLFSGNAEAADLRNEAWLHGYNFEVLLKPVLPEALLARVRDALVAESRQS